MNSRTTDTDSEVLARYLSRIGTGTQLLALFTTSGGIVAADGVYPVVSASYTTILAAGALIFAASSYFEVKALEARLDARESRSCPK